MLTSVLCSHCVMYLLSNEEVPVPPVNLPEDNRTLTQSDIYRQLGPAEEKCVCLHAPLHVVCGVGGS